MDPWTFALSPSPSRVRFLAVLAALSLQAADISVRREGPEFHIVGTVTPEAIAIYAGEGDVPPVLGVFTVVENGVVFKPRFEIAGTVDCRVVVNGKTFRFAGAKPSGPNRTATVVQVYPSGGTIPANQLKFYIHFSEPMKAGQAWRNVKLLDENGKVVELAFLEIDQELWDRDMRRLTVLFDPGRIKRGVLPREEVGAALVEGKHYTLEISENWPPLKTGYRKVFVVGPEDREAIDPVKWRVSLPKSNTREPLKIDFGESLDAALAIRLIMIAGVPGQAVLGKAEREWFYTPDEPWKAGPVRIAIDTALEDLAGNKVGRPFDVDTFDRITARTDRGVTNFELMIK